MKTVNEILHQLEEFWYQFGCSVIPSFNCELGAATLHPLCVFNCVYGNSFAFSYLQTCYRPGDNLGLSSVSKLCQHNQYQVLLAPFPENSQMLYLKSLEYIGVKLDEHDIRFIRDNWENPSVGANGVGWEVNFNGVEVSQFTYMQQVGGISCNSYPVEIAYGLERLALVLQKKDRIGELIWRDGITYDQLYKQQELELTQYCSNDGDIKNLFALVEDKLNAAMRFINDNSPFLAYRSCAECNHLLNLLDSKMAVDYYERVRLILELRGITRKACKLALDLREQKEIKDEQILRTK